MIFYCKILLKRKKIFNHVVFFIFAFYWNPKTLITGDIATNSLYKIVYNSSKIIFNYNGLEYFKIILSLNFIKNY